ncbi:MAG: glycosyltransferase [Clostridiales bacterium]|nr:glycosyltransferase [Clostridiales bacterium]
MKKISVIIPVYKVEKYLSNCLNSVIKQTYKNLEIIVVDDGSPDQCPQICDEYAERDSRIKVIHKKNGGLSSARNAGIDVATGDYLMFVDSDDTLNEHMCEILINQLIEKDADIAMSSFRNVYENKVFNKDINLKKIKSIFITQKDDVFDLLFNKRIPMIMLAWGKLYKKELFDNIRYPDGKIHEDEFIIHELLNDCNKFVFVNLPLYNYLIRNTSITGECFTERRLDCVEAKQNRVEFIKKNRNLFLDKAINQYINVLILYYFKSKWANLNEGIISKLKKEIDGFVEKNKNNKVLKLYKYFPWLLEIILKVKYK